MHHKCTTETCITGSCIEKKRNVWSKEDDKHIDIVFLRLNMIDDYNSQMGDVDIADQLRGSYRPDHWLRNRKWWWSLFLWAIGVAAANGYVSYKRMYESEAKKKKDQMPRLLTHEAFQKELAFDLIWPRKKGASSSDSVDSVSTSSTTSTRTKQSGHHDLSTTEGQYKYCKEVNPKRLKKGSFLSSSFPFRNDSTYHPPIPTPNHAYCQLCDFLIKNKKRTLKPLVGLAA